MLPESSGGVTAFKFRDPEGHPLELLAFPTHRTPPRWQAAAHPGLFLGIDHSAISVRNTERSLAFYRQLGLRLSAGSLNERNEQQHLDALDRPEVIHCLRRKPAAQDRAADTKSGFARPLM